MLTASVKAGQAFVSSACQRKPESQSASFALAQTPENLQPAPVQHGEHCLPLEDEINEGQFFERLPINCEHKISSE